MHGAGGWVDTTGVDLPRWVTEFLADDDRADVRRKLMGTCAARREVFIPVAMVGAPWSVVGYLTDGDGTTVPAAAPSLPGDITGVWLAPLMFRKTGVRWTGLAWQRFALL
jgi:hypothetical protein